MKNIKNIVKDNKKILIFGCSGSGKSTLAKEISKECNIKNYPLDKIKWQPNWEKTPKDIVIAKINDMSTKDSYIIEGRYNRVLDKVIKECDLIIILNTPTLICIYRSIKRTLISFLKGKKGHREDLPEGCKESIGFGYLELLKIIWNYKKTKGAETAKFLEEYSDKVVNL